MWVHFILGNIFTRHDLKCLCLNIVLLCGPPLPIPISRSMCQVHSAQAGVYVCVWERVCVYILKPLVHKARQEASEKCMQSPNRFFHTEKKAFDARYILQNTWAIEYATIIRTASIKTEHQHRTHWISSMNIHSVYTHSYKFKTCWC